MSFATLSSIEVPLLSSFPVNVTALMLPSGGNVFALRDDLLDGGTKSRALKPFLSELRAKGYSDFGYASPFAGFAQLALSYACRDLGLKCQLFSQADPSTQTMHPITREAQAAGASVQLVPSLAIAEEYCAEWEGMSPKKIKVPLGLDCESYRLYLRQCLVEVWNQIRHQIDREPKRVWVSLGSGTLSVALRGILPEDVELCCIDVHVLESGDSRIQRVQELPNTRYYSSPYPFAKACFFLPPIPSNRHYDAKVWSFLASHSSAGDLWWNVAR